MLFKTCFCGKSMWGYVSGVKE